MEWLQNTLHQTLQNTRQQGGGGQNGVQPSRLVLSHGLGHGVGLGALHGVHQGVHQGGPLGESLGKTFQNSPKFQGQFPVAGGGMNLTPLATRGGSAGAYELPIALGGLNLTPLETSGNFAGAHELPVVGGGLAQDLFSPRQPDSGVQGGDGTSSVEFPHPPNKGGDWGGMTGSGDLPGSFSGERPGAHPVNYPGAMVGAYGGGVHFRGPWAPPRNPLKFCGAGGDDPSPCDGKPSALATEVADAVSAALGKAIAPEEVETHLKKMDHWALSPRGAKNAELDRLYFLMAYEQKKYVDQLADTLKTVAAPALRGSGFDPSVRSMTCFPQYFARDLREVIPLLKAAEPLQGHVATIETILEAIEAFPKTLYEGGSVYPFPPYLLHHWQDMTRRLKVDNLTEEVDHLKTALALLQKERTDHHTPSALNTFTVDDFHHYAETIAPLGDILQTLSQSSDIPMGKKYVVTGLLKEFNKIQETDHAIDAMEKGLDQVEAQLTTPGGPFQTTYDGLKKQYHEALAKIQEPNQAKLLGMKKFMVQALLLHKHGAYEALIDHLSGRVGHLRLSFQPSLTPVHFPKPKAGETIADYFFRSDAMLAYYGDDDAKNIQQQDEDEQDLRKGYHFGRLGGGRFRDDLRIKAMVPTFDDDVSPGDQALITRTAGDILMEEWIHAVDHELASGLVKDVSFERKVPRPAESQALYFLLEHGVPILQGYLRSCYETDHQAALDHFAQTGRTPVYSNLGVIEYDAKDVGWNLPRTAERIARALKTMAPGDTRTLGRELNRSGHIPLFVDGRYVQGHVVLGVERKGEDAWVLRGKLPTAESPRVYVTVFRGEKGRNAGENDVAPVASNDMGSLTLYSGDRVYFGNLMSQLHKDHSISGPRGDEAALKSQAVYFQVP